MDHMCDCGEHYRSSAAVLACADRNHGQPRRRTQRDTFKDNRKRLQEVIKAQTRVDYDGAMLNARIRRLVRDAERGTLDHDDSLILAAFAVSTLKECLP